MICEVCIFDNQSSRVAAWYCADCDLKMSDEAFKVIHRAGSGREDHPRISFRCSRWGVVEPQGLLSGARQGMGIASYELAGGFYDLFAAPIKGGADGFAGVGSGVVHGLTQLFARTSSRFSRIRAL